MIEVAGLSKRYGAKYAINDVSFTVDKGEIIGLLGPNGAGKSTTMNILTGYLSATDGVVKIHGYDILDEPLKAKKHIGYLPEIPPLYIDMTVKEYLDFMYDLKKVKLPKSDHIKDICEQVKITDVKDRLIRNLSKGYRQRVGLAQAMIGNPDVLILDEPTVGLDPQQIIDIRTLIQSLGKKHTIILSSHILSEIQAVCSRIIVINQGEIIANGTPDELADQFAQDTSIHIRVKGPEKDILKKIKDISGVNDVESYGELESGTFDFKIQPEKSVDIRENIFGAMSSANFPILSMSTNALTLEEVFLKITALASSSNTVDKKDVDEKSDLDKVALDEDLEKEDNEWLYSEDDGFDNDANIQEPEEADDERGDK